jgi:hypothetical protein
LQHLESQLETGVPETDVEILRQELGKALEQADAWSRTCLDLQRQQRQASDVTGLGPEAGVLAEELRACEAEKMELQQQLATVTRANNSQEVSHDGCRAASEQPSLINRHRLHNTVSTWRG